ncbi:hypothetical protein DL237_05095 [Pseudooceanicola sediminis]|uniref:Uncharacterized protein n=1 Tax=Pseudooceanicola sediminis TaxID=2211117 RepID=A0A399J482_9RHOB|nr:hypothetical protein [Pseudooceanicola sediminis]KAA2311453.1 hypothetical protein E0K93_20465 [Puniceibacterium sp. HSS470]RII40060.1 hypothetical protein DL237_05095 [Pseudooceanicola sediminis]
MTNMTPKRRVQIVCAAFLHIPLVAIAAFALSEGFASHVSILTVCLVATLVSTLFVVAYIGRVMGAAAAMSPAK